MKISYEDFFDCISKIIDHCNKLNQCSKILSFDFVQDMQNIVDQLEYVLTKLCDDEECGWISYWMWELDFGKKYYDGCVTDQDGEPIKLETIKDLYDMLEKNYCSDHII